VEAVMSVGLDKQVARRNDVSVKMDADVVDECRTAASIRKQSLAEFISEEMREAAKRVIDEFARERSQAALGERPKPKRIP
jgi:uncharacterized protein (DUF1778 family)